MLENEVLDNEVPDNAEPQGAAPDPNALPPSIPIGELLTRREAAATLVVGVALVVGSFVRYSAGTHAVVGAILGPVLVLLSAIDLRHRLLPNIIVGPAAGVIAVVVAVGEWHHVGAHLAAGAIAGGILFVLAIVNPRGMGMGDAKLAFLIGIALASRTIAAMVYTSGALIVLAVGLVVLRGRSGLKATIPFGPLLALGALIAYFTQ
jgi:prepilin signal peptidase PulO-like enzyme (type II secretory pathway)